MIPLLTRNSIALTNSFSVIASVDHQPAVFLTHDGISLFEVSILDDETLILVERLEGLNLNEVYDELYQKNDISENNEWWTSRMTDDLISILTDESRDESFGYIELAESFEPHEVPKLDVMVSKKISIHT